MCVIINKIISINHMMLRTISTMTFTSDFSTSTYTISRCCLLRLGDAYTSGGLSYLVGGLKSVAKLNHVSCKTAFIDFIEIQVNLSAIFSFH